MMHLKSLQITVPINAQNLQMTIYFLLKGYRENTLHNYLPYQTECTGPNLAHSYLFKITIMKILVLCLTRPIFFYITSC